MELQQVVAVRLPVGVPLERQRGFTAIRGCEPSVPVSFRTTSDLRLPQRLAIDYD